VCGRFTLATPAQTIAAVFGLADPEDGEEIPELAPRYNIAPTETVVTIRARADGAGTLRRMLEPRRWGLVPHFAREIAGPPLFNARAETLSHRPAFRDGFRRRRCLVPADGFYEWRAVSGRRQPFHQRRVDGAPFAMAGLYDDWRSGTDEPVASCTVITTKANALLAPLHERMPVILAASDWDAWLDPERYDMDALSALLRPAPEEGWVSYAVDTAVNRAKHDAPSNVEPLFDLGSPAQ